MSKVEIEVFHDGKCPLCQREMQLLQRLDRTGAIRFVDISADDFDPLPLGVSWQALMERIHARLPDGTLIEGVEVFRRLYAAVGFRRLAALSRLPVAAQLLDVAYHLFAKNRLRLTGRCSDGACPVHVRGHSGLAAGAGADRPRRSTAMVAADPVATRSAPVRSRGRWASHQAKAWARS